MCKHNAIALSTPQTLGVVLAQAMCFQLRDALRVGCIGLSKWFFCNTMEKREMLKVLDDEMRNFSILVEAPKTPCAQAI